MMNVIYVNGGMFGFTRQLAVKVVGLKNIGAVNRYIRWNFLKQ